MDGEKERGTERDRERQRETKTEADRVRQAERETERAAGREQGDRERDALIVYCLWLKIALSTRGDKINQF